MTSGRGGGVEWRQVEERQYGESGRIRINMSDIKWSRHISDISISNIVARPLQGCVRDWMRPLKHISKLWIQRVTPADRNFTRFASFRFERSRYKSSPTLYRASFPTRGRFYSISLSVETCVLLCLQEWCKFATNESNLGNAIIRKWVFIHSLLPV